LLCSAGQNGNGIGHNYPDENSLPTDSEMDFGDDEVDYQHEHTGMAREDISKRLKDILGTAFSSSRSDEVESAFNMVLGQRDTPLQEARLQLMQDNKATLIGSQNLARAIARLLWPCHSCGESGHSADKCPANSNAAAAAADLDEAGGAAGNGTAKSNADKKAKKRSKRATKEAQAENAVASTADGSSVADSEAATAGAEGEAAAAGDGAAKPAERGARAKSTAAARQPAAEPTAAEDDDGEQEADSEDGAAAGEDDLTALISTFAPGRSKAGTKAGLAVPPPQPRDDPNRSSSADAPEAASAVSGTSGGPADAAKDTEQPEQKDDGKRGRNRSGRKKRGDSDVEQVWHCIVLDMRLLLACTMRNEVAVLQFLSLQSDEFWQQGVSAAADSKVDPVRPGSSSSQQDARHQQQCADWHVDSKCHSLAFHA
jgi:hypothetical protein